MITPTQVYWITRLDAIVEAFVGLQIIVALIVIGLTIYFAGTLIAEERKSAITILKFDGMFVAALIVLLFATSLIPTTKQMAAIMVIPKVANSQTVQEIGGGIVDLAKDWLDELKPGRAAPATAAPATAAPATAAPDPALRGPVALGIGIPSGRRYAIIYATPKKEDAK